MKCLEKAVAASSLFSFAAAGITGGVGEADADGDELAVGFGIGWGSALPPQPASRGASRSRPIVAASVWRPRISSPLEPRTRVDGELTTPWARWLHRTAGLWTVTEARGET